MSWYQMLKDTLGFLRKHRNPQREDVVVDDLEWADRNEECQRLRAQGYKFAWRGKRKIPERLQEGWEYFTVKERCYWYRRVRFDDRVAGALYLLTKAPEELEAV